MSNGNEPSMSLPHTASEEIDYRETADITNVHDAIKREHQEPAIGEMAMPLWLISVLGVTLLWAGYYLGSYNAGFSGDVFNENEFSPVSKSTGPGPAGAAAQAPQQESPVAIGKRYFSQNCVTCHQASGLGQANVYPPLVKSEYVLGGSRRLGMILLKGLQGPVTVLGQKYNNAMPAWEKTLNDKKIASILTYVRQEWGNTGGAIMPEQIAAARKEFASRTEPWTEADLLAVPADAELTGAPSAPTEVKKGTPATTSEVKK